MSGVYCNASFNLGLLLYFDFKIQENMFFLKTQLVYLIAIGKTEDLL